MKKIGIKYFTKKDVKLLKKYYNNKKFDSYSYKIFEIVKRNSNDKFTVIDDDFYYNNLSSRIGNVLRKFENDIKPKNHHEFQDMLIVYYISIEEILKSVEKTFSGYKISAK